MQNNLPTEKDLITEIKFYYNKLKIAYQFFISNKSVLIIDNDVICFNHNPKDLHEIVNDLYLSSLTDQNKKFELKVDNLIKELV